MMVLAVSRWAQRGTSGMIEGLAACFTGLEDPRETRRCDHQLIDILVIAVCAVIACAESWEDIEPYGRIIDGRNRWLACAKAGVTCQALTYEQDDSTLVAFARSQNQYRRHLTQAQLAMGAGRIANLGHGGARFKRPRGLLKFSAKT